MGVGLGSRVAVFVGGGCVKVVVGVTVIVTVEVTVGGTTTSGVDRIAKYTKTAPITKNSPSRRIAIGRLRVTSGMRLPWTTFAG
jgi:hypothetical protein